MVEVGADPQPITGEPGGKPTGQKMSHYIDPTGKFIQAVRRMPKRLSSCRGRTHRPQG